jgi:hypothetical protein
MAGCGNAVETKEVINKQVRPASQLMNFSGVLAAIFYSLFPVPCFIHSPRATSGWVSTAAGRGWGRISAKPARRIPYAARMLKAMEPTDAAINIVKFNTSVIFCFRTLYLWSGTRRVPAQAAPKNLPDSPDNRSLRLSQKTRCASLLSIDQWNTL